MFHQTIIFFYPKFYLLIDNFKRFWDVVLFSCQQIGQLPGGRGPVIGITLLISPCFEVYVW